MDLSSCTEDRIHHALQRCLAGLHRDDPNQQFWNAGLSLNRWGLEELLSRGQRNSLILLQHLLTKTQEVLESSQYELVVPLTLLFSSTLLKTSSPWIQEGSVLQEAYSLFHGFLSWPEPCSSASKRLLKVIAGELRAPGISFQRLVREEQGLNQGTHPAKTITVLLAGAEECVPPEFQAAVDQLKRVQLSPRAAAISLVSHAVRSSLGNAYTPHALRDALEAKGVKELEEAVGMVTESTEMAATSSTDLETARQELMGRMEQVARSLGILSPQASGVNVGGEAASGKEELALQSSSGEGHEGAEEVLHLPYARFHVCPWEKDNFDNLSSILANEIHHDLAPDLFPDSDDDGDEEGEREREEEEVKNEGEDPSSVETSYAAEKENAQQNRFSSGSWSSRDSVLSCHSLSSSWSVPSRSPRSSGIDSDLAEEVAAETDGASSPPDSARARRKPKKKSRSLLRVERLSLMFKTPRSPSAARRALSTDCRDEDAAAADSPSASRLERPRSHPSQEGTPQRGGRGSSDPPEKPVCLRRRPILSCEEEEEEEGGGGEEQRAALALVRVVVMGGDRELGRLARAYSLLQRTERRAPRLNRRCRLRFFFVPARGGTAGDEGPSDPLKAATPCSQESGAGAQQEASTDIAHLLALMDPWYHRSVLSLLSMSSQVLCQTTCKTDNDVTGSSSSSRADGLPLLADLLLYYCRHAHQPALLQLYKAELRLAGGERIREVFIYSLELGHTAGTRAVRAMGAASKRFGIHGDREAVPLTLGVAYNKVSVSGRSRWTDAREMACTSINLHKACRRAQLVDLGVENLLMSMTEVLKRQSTKSKMGYNQLCVSEVRVDRVCVRGTEGTTFAVCLDQDEKRIIQGVSRCDVSLCCKPGSTSDWWSHRPLPGRVRPLHPAYCSLLCLPINSFTASSH